MGQLLESLPAGQRALRYRQFAQDALEKAGRAFDPKTRADLLSMASSWHTLAEEVERFTDRISSVDLSRIYQGQLQFGRR